LVDVNPDFPSATSGSFDIQIGGIAAHATLPFSQGRDFSFDLSVAPSVVSFPASSQQYSIRFGVLDARLQSPSIPVSLQLVTPFGNVTSTGSVSASFELQLDPHTLTPGTLNGLILIDGPVAQLTTLDPVSGQHLLIQVHPSALEFDFHTLVLVPEPSTLPLAAFGLLALAAVRSRRRRFARESGILGANSTWCWFQLW
jgi:hypothetical protein